MWLFKNNRRKMNRIYCVYIMTNKYNNVIYTGFTGNLRKRVFDHKEKVVDSFTKKYNVNKLVYYECTNNVYSAKSREHQIKAGSRSKKIALVNSMNKEWKDLSFEI